MTPAGAAVNFGCGVTEVSMVTLLRNGNSNDAPTVTLMNNPPDSVTITDIGLASIGTWQIDIKTCFTNFPAICKTDTMQSTLNVADPCLTVTPICGTIDVDPFMTSALEGASAITPLPQTFLSATTNSIDNQAAFSGTAPNCGNPEFTVVN
jgi:hypothetical protein